MLFIEVAGKPCFKCGSGVYQETSLSDVMDGVVHCNNCGYEQPSVIEECDPDERFTLNEDHDILVDQYFYNIE